MRLAYKDVEVSSRVDGEKVPAKLCTCPNCQGEEWIVYLVRDHPHLQCVACGETFCQGDCRQ